jgi:hypothetical protein
VLLSQMNRNSMQCLDVNGYGLKNKQIFRILASFRATKELKFDSTNLIETPRIKLGDAFVDWRIKILFFRPRNILIKKNQIMFMRFLKYLIKLLARYENITE